MRQQLRQGLSSGLPSALYQLESNMTSLTARSSRLVSSPKSNGTHVFVQKRGVTQQYVQRMKDAEARWAVQAEEIKAGKKQSFLSMLEERGLVQSVVGDRDTLDKIITNKRIGWYAGIDPTGPSLHVGHMLSFMILGWAYVHGMKSVFLLGGSTGKVGDPTGRSDSRPMMNTAIRRSYIASMHIQLKRLGLSFEKYGGKHGYKWEWAWRRALENNNVWWQNQTFHDVVTTLGSHMRLGPMLGRDSVKPRLESGEGMSFAEFCYPIMQAWDYWYLYQRGVQVQVGGSDQYGNILFGIDAVKSMIKHHGEKEFAHRPGLDPDLIKPMGLTTPLLTTASGEKIGKSAGNAIWLDPDMNPSYDLYQYFMRLPDADVGRLLKMLTFVPLPKISEIMEEHNQDPSKRTAHHVLAREFVEIAHGAPFAIEAERQHKTLFMSNRPQQEGDAEIETPKGGVVPVKEQIHNLPFTTAQHHLTLPRSLVVGQFFHKILHSAGLASSKQEAFRLIVNNGASVGAMPSGKEKMGDALNYIPIRTWPAYVTETFIIDNSLLIIRIGKWKVKIIRIISDEEFKEKKMSVPGWEQKDTTEEELKDRELMSQRRRIAGRQVRLPAIASPGKPKIVRLRREPKRNDNGKDNNNDAFTRADAFSQQRPSN